jgi:molecular chaperone GrpE (heat shock protein)
MKRLIILAITMALASVAGAQQLYKYVDKTGKTVYSDQPPPDVDSKQISVSTGRGTAVTPPKSAVERDKELDKARKDLADKGKKSGEESDRQAQNEQRCAGLRQNYQMYADGGRISKINEKGERDMMTDAEIEQARERTRREMDEACKK